MSAIISFSIGSPQSFISQARRTQDLYQGSLILSYLASKAVEVAESATAQLLYPPADQKESIPNQLVIRYNGDPSHAQQHAEAIQTAVKSAWEKISKHTLDYFLRFVDKADHEQVKEIWNRQATAWLTCYWTVTVEQDGLPYAIQLKRATLDMATRKMLRNFEPINENGRKCSITGEHEILHDKQWDGRIFWEKIREPQRNLSLVGEHERLSAISAIKRFAHEHKEDRQPINEGLVIPHRFPSTSSIAASTFKYGVIKKLLMPESDDLRQALSHYLDELLSCFEDAKALLFTKNGEMNPEYFGKIDELLKLHDVHDELIQKFLCVDGDFLFDDTLIMPTLTEYGGNPTNKQLTSAKHALASFIKTAQKHGIASPQPYLVILSMDGDNMGKTLGKLKGQAEHLRFSQTVAEFARDDVKRIVEIEHVGRVVYAGGDDVLALLPIRDALEVADQLRKAFADRMEAAKIETNMDGQYVHMTASTGLAYIHHTHVLQDAVHQSHHAQKIAKDECDRNAFAIHFLRRSGEPRTIRSKWEANGESVCKKVADPLIKAFCEGDLSRAIPYDLSQMIYSMVGETVSEKAQQAELERVLKRRIHNRTDIEIDHLVKEITDAFTILRAGSCSRTDSSWHNLQHWLELSRFIAQEEASSS